MRRSLARFLAIPVATAGLSAGIAVAAPSAFADVTDTGGSATISVPFSYLAQLGKAYISASVVPPLTATADTTNQVENLTAPVTGGNADASKIFGALNLGGSLVLSADNDTSQGDTDNEGSVTLSNLTFSIDTMTISATPQGSTTPIPLLDANGATTVTASSTNQTLTNTELDLDPAAAAYLNQALDTNAFAAGQNVGTFSAAWTITGS